MHWFGSLEDAQAKDRLMPSGGTTMSIGLTGLSRVSALGNTLDE